MITIKAEVIEKEVIGVVKKICAKLKIKAQIDGEFCPGNFIKSQVLLTFISGIADALGVIIPNECYIFSEKYQKQLSIKETAEKIIKVAKYDKQK